MHSLTCCRCRQEFVPDGLGPIPVRELGESVVLYWCPECHTASREMDRRESREAYAVLKKEYEERGRELARYKEAHEERFGRD